MAEGFRHFEAYGEGGDLGASSKRVRTRVVLLRVLTLLIGTTALVCEYGFYQHPLTGLLPKAIVNLPLRLFEVIMFIAYVLDIWLSERAERYALPEGRKIRVDRIAHAIGALGILLAVTQALPSAWHLFEAVLSALLLYELWILNVTISRRISQPGVLLPLSFLMLIAVGSAMLMLPRAVPPGQRMSFIDSLFTITSAVCVTGLIVRDTATQFTPFGQIVICIFIQLGGLGIIIFGSMLAMLLGTRLSLQQNIGLKSMLNEQPLSRVTGLVRFIVLTTLAIELLGAAVMMPMWPSDMPFNERLGMSIFHAVSAFCNAGFSLNSDSLVSYRYSAITHGVILWLVVVGGIGFPVLYNVWSAIKWRVIIRTPRLRRRLWDIHPRELQTALLRDQRLSLSTKMVITTTAVLYIGGAVFFSIGQFTPYIHQALSTGVTAHRADREPLTVSTAGGILADASFQSITARTAGFNSMPMEEVSPVGRFVLMALMLVGGSPGGTAGGVKTTSVALVLLSIWATMKQRNESEAFGRQIADSLVRKAATLAACYIALIAAGILLLSISEVAPFVHITFEVISATTTTGLSLGMTDSLTSFGRIVIILLMFLGRVGPLTLLGAVVIGVNRKRPYQYPHESVLIG